MKFEKLIASFMSAILLVTPVFAAYTLGDYPEPLCHYDADTGKSTCNFLVVAGADAATADGLDGRDRGRGRQDRAG